MKPLLIYVAGPYRAPTAWGIEQNIHAARAMGVQIAKHGAYPVIPHAKAEQARADEIGMPIFYPHREWPTIDGWLDHVAAVTEDTEGVR